MNKWWGRWQWLVVVPVVLALVLGQQSPVSAQSVASEDNGVRLEFRNEPQGDGTHVLSILIRNDRPDNIGGLTILGHLPYGATLIESWTGTARDENPGRIIDDWVGWNNDEVLAENIQGPWRYRVRVTPGYTLDFYARVIWVGPNSGDLWSEKITIAGPELPPDTPQPTPAPQTQSPRVYMFRVSHTTTDADCNHTRLFGTVENGNGLLVKTWNDWGNESISMVGLDRQEGTWERYIGPNGRPGIWHAQVIHPETRGPLSPVSTVQFIGKGCEEKGAIQSIWIHFKRN